MRAHTKESGFALILLIGITAALAILAATLVMLLDNQQHATAAERKTKTSLDYAEAALNSAVNACKNDTSWLGSGSTTLTSAYLGANYPSGGPTVTYLIYDNLNPIDYSKNYDFNGDHEVWVETDTTWLGKTSKVRQLVSSSTTTSILPKAAAYADTDIVLSGSANIYGVLPDGTPDTSGAPYPTTIMAGQDITASSSMTLAAPADGTHTQSLGLEANGNITTSGHTFNITSGTVGLLSDYFDQAHQAALTAEAQSGMPTQATVATKATTTPTATTISGTLLSTLQGTSSQTYSTATALYYNGNLTLSAKSGNASTFAFSSLYVTGTLTITGNVSVTSSAIYAGSLTIGGAATAVRDNFGQLYVGGALSVTGSEAVTTAACYAAGAMSVSGATTALSDSFGSLYVVGTLTFTGNENVATTALYSGNTFTISGTTAVISDSFGPTYCAGTIDWNGSTSSTPPLLSITTGALFAKIFGVDANSSDNSSYDGSSGPTSITLGPTWIDGDAGTGDIAVDFAGPSNTASTVMCPLLATTEQTHINGLVNLGTLTTPMVYYMQCDNDGLYSNTFQYNGTGTFTGLMVLFEAPFNMTSGNVVGAVLEGTPVDNDITMSGSSSICYNQTAIDHCTSDSLRTTTVTAVPGSWQQLVELNRVTATALRRRRDSDGKEGRAAESAARPFSSSAAAQRAARPPSGPPLDGGVGEAVGRLVQAQADHVEAAQQLAALDDLHGELAAEQTAELDVVEAADLAGRLLRGQGGLHVFGVVGDSLHRELQVGDAGRGGVEQAQVRRGRLDVVEVPLADEVAQVVEHVVDRARQAKEVFAVDRRDQHAREARHELAAHGVAAPFHGRHALVGRGAVDRAAGHRARHAAGVGGLGELRLERRHDREAAVQAVLHRLVDGQEEVVLAEQLGEPAAPEHVEHERAHAGEDQVAAAVAQVVRQAHERLGGGHVEVGGRLHVPHHDARLGQRVAQQLVEAVDGEARVGEEELTVEAEDEQTGEGLVLGVTSGVAVGRRVGHTAQLGGVRAACAVDQHGEREPHGDPQAGQHAERQHAHESGQRGHRVDRANAGEAPQGSSGRSGPRRRAPRRRRGWLRAGRGRPG